jgi:LuxR family maltose regulon positive regulatory protein
LDHQALLILDDYHRISSQSIHEGIAYLLEYQPQNMHIALSTRADPPLPLFRLRARDQLTEVRSNDLRFRDDESTLFLNSTMGLDLSSENVRALEARTEGWAVGLQLAGLSLHGRSDADRFVAEFSGSHRYILEYLTEEVVRCQSDTVQQFLLETSILDRLCGPLCEAVCAGPLGSSADQILSELERNNLFIIPLDDEARWYRYHHLFADLLGNHLRRALQEQEILRLHLRASQWFEQSGDEEAAITHALHAKDYERAAVLLEEIGQRVLSQGRLGALLKWMRALPPQVVSNRPRLCLQQGWAMHLAGHSTDAEPVLRKAKAVMSTMPPSPENQALRGQLAAVLTGIATLTENPARVLRQGTEALTYLPPDDMISRARVHVAMGTAHAYSDDMDKAIQSWHRARDMAIAAGNLFLATAAIELLAGLQIFHLGQLREASQALGSVLDMGTTEDGKRLPFTATAYILLSRVYLEWNELDTALDYLDKGMDLIEQGGIGYSLPYAHCTQACISLARRDLQDASAALDKAVQSLAAQSLPHMVIHHATCQVQLHLHQGRVAQALDWATNPFQAGAGGEPDRLPAYLEEVLVISLARVLLAQGEVGRALRALAEIQDHAETSGRMAHVLEIHLLKAVAMNETGDSGAAIDSLQKALLLAQREGYVQPFLETGPSLRPMLLELQGKWAGSSDSKLPAFLTKVLPATKQSLHPGRPLDWHDQQDGSVVLPEVLTRRELEVLTLLCEGCSNQEIADRLSVTLHTVKKHSSNIYGKLAVPNRTKAVLRARELDLC